MEFRRVLFRSKLGMDMQITGRNLFPTPHKIFVLLSAYPCLALRRFQRMHLACQENRHRGEMVDLGLFSRKLAIRPDGETLQVEKNFTRWQKVFCHAPKILIRRFAGFPARNVYKEWVSRLPRQLNARSK